MLQNRFAAHTYLQQRTEVREGLLHSVSLQVVPQREGRPKILWPSDLQTDTAESLQARWSPGIGHPNSNRIANFELRCVPAVSIVIRAKCLAGRAASISPFFL